MNVSATRSSSTHVMSVPTGALPRTPPFQSAGMAGPKESAPWGQALTQSSDRVQALVVMRPLARVSSRTETPEPHAAVHSPQRVQRSASTRTRQTESRSTGRNTPP